MRWATVVPLLAVACADNLTPPPERDPYDPGAPPPLACSPDLDGRIDADELRAAVGVPVSYLVSPAGVEREVDLAGAVNAEGHLVWDLGADHADDQVATLAAAPLLGRWYADAFAAGQFVAPFDAGGAIEAVYAHDEQGLWLIGLASSAEDPPEGRTLLVYGAPVALFRFPITPGASWTSTGQIANGTLGGLPYAGRDVYQGEVDATGRLVLPDLTFTQAHRVRLRVTNEPAVGAPQTRRQVSWLFECFGEVARATSRANEPQEDFTTAAELRRLGL